MADEPPPSYVLLIMRNTSHILLRFIGIRYDFYYYYFRHNMSLELTIELEIKVIHVYTRKDSLNREAAADFYRICLFAYGSTVDLGPTWIV